MLVTGGCGFIGSNLAAKLLSLGHNVTIVDNLAGPRDDYHEFLKSHEGINFVEGCFAGEEIVNKIKAKEFDYVFHNAAIPRVSYSVENPYETTEVNVGRTTKLLEACSGNVKRESSLPLHLQCMVGLILCPHQTHIKSHQSLLTLGKSHVQKI